MWLSLFIVLAFVLHGAIALWAARSTWNWIARATIVMLVLAALLVIPAYEPIVCFATQMIVAVGLVVCFTRVKRPQFSVADVLVIIFIFALGLMLIIRLPNEPAAPWWFVVTLGVLTGVLAAAAHYAANIRLKFAIPLGVLCIAGGTPALFAAATAIREPPILAEELDPQAWRFGIAVYFVSIFGWARFHGPAWRIPHIALVTGAFVSYAIVYLKMVFPTPIPVTEFPEPNGYDDLIAAMNILDSDILTEATTVNPKATKAEVQKYAADFRRLELGLTRQIRLPLSYDQDDLNRIFERSPRQLGHALRVKASVADTAMEAAECHLNAIRLGRESRRGGLYIHEMIGIAIEMTGYDGLARYYPQLTNDELRLVSKQLKGIAPVESFENFHHRELIWIQHAFDWQGRLSAAFVTREQLTSNDLRKMMIRFRIQHLANQRQLLIHFEILKFFREHDRLPRSLPELQRPPEEDRIDPFTNSPLRYEIVDPNSYKLSSAGDEQGEVVLLSNVVLGGYGPPSANQQNDPLTKTVPLESE